ncbi:MAG: hypothetical protein IT368_09745 [Candidatus Hydrogenedentes bacterium]|nr:hypothetical protein [Candidatus Hydrogenedentota bacterium]
MNVRWDAVVDHNRFWNEADNAGTSGERCGSGAPVTVKVWLFGGLADGVAERPITLQFREGFCPRDVFTAMRVRLGDDFVDQIADAQGNKFRYCRLFIDGMAADDVDAPVRSTSAATQVEMILLTATEGG